MTPDTRTRPGFTRLACGVIFLGLAGARLAAGPEASPGWPGPELVTGTAGVAVGLWGWSVLRKAKADRPDLTWRRFLRDEFVVALIMAVTIPLWLALPGEVRDAIVKRLQEWAELLSIARGRP